jgi:hypothetical protein
LTKEDIRSIEISSNGDFIILNALEFVLLIRITPVKKLRSFLVPIFMMKVGPHHHHHQHHHSLKPSNTVEIVQVKEDHAKVKMRKAILDNPEKLPGEIINAYNKLENGDRDPEYLK